MLANYDQTPPSLAEYYSNANENSQREEFEKKIFSERKGAEGGEKVLRFVGSE